MGFIANIELGASLWSSNSVLVVCLVAVGGHQSAVEGIHPGALVVPDPEPDNNDCKCQIIGENF